MRLTKFTHACVRLDDGDRSLVIDPGIFSEAAEAAEALDGVGALLITHEHPDHVDDAAVRAALAADSSLHVWAPAVVAANFGDRATTVGPDESFTAAGFEVGTVGGQHALVHPLVPVCANLGYRIPVGGGAIYHPGDSLVVPTEPVSVLLLPTSAPWLALREAVDFATAVRAPRAFQVHDAFLSSTGTATMERILSGLVGRFGVDFEHLAPHTGAEI